jgi:hypothetical protein
VGEQIESLHRANGHPAQIDEEMSGVRVYTALVRRVKELRA